MTRGFRPDAVVLFTQRTNWGVTSLYETAPYGATAAPPHSTAHKPSGR